MGTEKKKKITKRLILNLFLVMLFLPLFLDPLLSRDAESKFFSSTLIDVCFGNSQNNQDYVEFFNIGQGDCTLIKTADSAALIDFGIKSDNNKIYTGLLKRGIKSLELAIITHHHTDHMGDFLNLAQNMKIERLIINSSSAEDGENELYQSIIETATKNGTEIIVPKAGNTFKIGNATLKILSVCSSADKENNRSIVAMVNIYGKKILFMGDNEAETEQNIVKSLDVDCDILKMGHHGSDTSSHTEFLKAASPEFAIASCGYDNLYRHPSALAVERAKEEGIEVLRTDLDRNIRVLFNSKNSTYTIETERGKVYDNIR